MKRSAILWFLFAVTPVAVRAQDGPAEPPAAPVEARYMIDADEPRHRMVYLVQGTARLGWFWLGESVVVGGRRSRISTITRERVEIEEAGVATEVPFGEELRRSQAAARKSSQGTERVAPPAAEDPGWQDLPVEEPDPYGEDMPDEEIPEYEPEESGEGFSAVKSEQVDPDHWKIAPEEWENVGRNLQSYLTEVEPAVIMGTDGDVLGLKLQNVKEGSLAWQRGFRTGDIVQRVNGDAVTSVDDLNKLVEKYKGNARVFVLVDRFGRRLTMTFELLTE
ncbi:MAG: PDZ domain-containing protein [Planctomycetes bacterium]|nr:PDZ domain-containing protein [Planctomycetota bacterium]